MSDKLKVTGMPEYPVGMPANLNRAPVSVSSGHFDRVMTIIRDHVDLSCLIGKPMIEDEVEDDLRIPRKINGNKGDDYAAC